MTAARQVAPHCNRGETLDLATDVLVIGAGPSAAWAAVGACVVLVDKGYLGTSGATAPSNIGTCLVPPGDQRCEAIDRRRAVAAASAHDDVLGGEGLPSCIDALAQRKGQLGPVLVPRPPRWQGRGRPNAG
jgi:succinate dehydrogenase/fumarate reductase flavoprotein subunit